MRAAALIVLLAAGCGETCYLELIEGSEDNHAGLVHPGDRLQYEAHIEGVDVSCGGIWLVNGIVGGSAGFGTIDDCGRYAAPTTFPGGLVELELEAIFPGLGSSCEYAYARLTPAP